MSDYKRPLPITQSISNGFWKLQMRMDTEVGSELSMSGQNGRTATRVTICQRRFCSGTMSGRWLTDIGTQICVPYNFTQKGDRGIGCPSYTALSPPASGVKGFDRSAA